MKNLSSNEIRTLWLKFFKAKGHYIIPSASLIPVNDDSLLWINAGVATLKPYFNGTEQPPSKRMVNSQKAIRTGDIDNVGITTRHHTFFEMLGNFSIGDYFKEDAIKFAWELLTSKEYFGISKELLYITVYEDDEEAKKIWLEQGVDEEHIFSMGRNTNFWDMGKGPCGPSSEIFFDKGEKYDHRTAKELIEPDLENDRYVEIWNIVFSQFNNNGNGNYSDLPQRNIDTGAGLERIASALQGKPTNFETDLFEKMIEKLNSKTKFNYLYEYIPEKLRKNNEEQFNINSWFKKIVDYVRSISFAISDGATPDSTGRGYILRMLLRKAVVNKIKLNIDDNILHELVNPLIETMGNFYPNLREKKDTIISIIKNEEDQFVKTLSSATKKLNEYINKGKLNEENAYKLHETFGLPLDILKDLSKNYDALKKLDWEKINKLDKEFKEKSKGKDLTLNAMKIQDETFRGLGETKFIGYTENKSTSKVVFISGEYVIFDTTPFYATSGGQESDFGKADVFDVVYVEKNAEKTFIHNIPGHNFKIGDTVQLSIDIERRKGLTIHHSATHLLFGALDKITGTIIPQHGSKVEDSFLRFDFIYQNNVDKELIDKIENLANAWINDSSNVSIEMMELDEAKRIGAGYLEGAKYSDIVRVVIMNDNVIDMCGGTHVSNTSDIEKILVTKFEKRGSGIWRIEALAGNENISKGISILNKKMFDDKFEPIINKINNFNNKANELKLNLIDFSDEINQLNIESINFKFELEELISKINFELKQRSNDIYVEIEKNISNELETNNKIILESEFLNIQEMTRPALSIIDSKNGDVALMISKNGEKQTFGFVINKKYIDGNLIEKIKQFANKYNLNGNGKKQQYIFGGKNFDNSNLIEEFNSWEF